MFVGAVSAGLFYGAGEVLGHGNPEAFGLKHLAKTAAHAAIGCAQSTASGGRCAPGAMAAGFASFAGPIVPNMGTVGNGVARAVIGGVAAKLGGGKFANGAATGAFAYAAGAMAGGGAAGGPTDSQGTGGTAFVGGFFDYWTEGPAYQEYQRAVGRGENAAYFTWDQDRALGSWIDSNGGNVNVVGHSYGGDTAASVVARGYAVTRLVTVDPVSWFRPNYANVAANAGTWTNLNATGGQGSWPNLVAGVGGAWNNAPAPHATSHWSISSRNHVNIMQCWAAPGRC